MELNHTPQLNDWEPARVKEALAVQQKAWTEWHRHPGVIAIDVGYKMKEKRFLLDSNDNPVLAIRVHLHPKLDEAKCKQEGKTCFTNEVLEDLLGGSRPEWLQLDVIQARYGPCRRPSDSIEVSEIAKNRREHVDPLVGGVSIGNASGSGGTLGAVVYDATDATPCILSNWHVLAGEKARKGDDCIQPSLFDAGRATTDAVAKLKRWCIDEKADAALAQLTGDRQAAIGEIVGDGCMVRIRDIRRAGDRFLGLAVEKSGRTTRVSKGFVDGVGMSITIDFGNRVKQTFHNQLHIIPAGSNTGELTQSGDSGAIWLDEDGKAVGLHFAGENINSPLGDLAVANVMADVAEHLEFSFSVPYFKPRTVSQRLASTVNGEAADRELVRAWETISSALGPQPVPTPIGQDALTRVARLVRAATELNAVVGEPVPKRIG